MRFASSNCDIPIVSKVDTAQLTSTVERLHNVILAKADRRLVRQSEFQHNDYLWRTYAWGNHRDATLLAALELEDSLQDIVERIESNPGYGFQKGSDLPGSALQNLRSLRARNVTWYGPLRDEWFEEQPIGVKRDPNEIIYRGQRLIVVRGAKALQGICIRLEYQDFSFRHTIYGIPLPSLSEWQAKLILGTLWSSLGRYRLFMTAGKWGLWHDEIGAQDILSMPIRLSKQVDTVVQTIINVVDEIRIWNPHFVASIWSDKTVPDPSIQPPTKLLKQLDDAIFDLFELSEAERDLIKDFVTYKFDLFSNDTKAAALAQLNALPIDDQAWQEVLIRLEALRQPVSRRVYIDGMARMVTNTEIIIIKRNERRLWTRSIAREDAEATQLQAMNLQEVIQER